MHFNPEFMTNCFNENPILYNLKKESRLLKPPAKSVDFGINSLTFRGSLLSNNLPLRLKSSQTIDELELELNNLGKIYCACTAYCQRVTFPLFLCHYKTLDFSFLF